MASRTPNEAWSKSLDADTYYKQPAKVQTANVAYFQRKIQLTGFSAYPDDSPSQLIRISGALCFLYCS
jgi:hypothetical protein